MLPGQKAQLHVRVVRNARVDDRDPDCHRLLPVVEDHHSGRIPVEPAVTEHAAGIREADDRALPEAADLLVHTDQLRVEADHLLVLTPPGVRPPVVRVREPADARFVAVVERRCAGPGHLHDCRLAIDALAHALRSRFRPEIREPPHASRRPGQKP